MTSRNKIWPASDNAELERSREMLYDSLCQHIVCLGVRFTRLDTQGISDGMEYLAHYSFFVVSIGDKWFLVTAGHVLKQLNTAVREKHVRVESYFLADYFGKRKTINSPTPFPFETEPQVFFDNDKEGLDFGFIPLRDLFKDRLQKNGIVSISEKHWLRQEEPKIRAFWVLGFPEEVNQQFNKPIKAGEDRKGVAAPVIISADLIEDLAEIPESVPMRETTHPRFIAKINVDISFNIEGMSGSPIFGLAETPSGHVGYTVVALQSSWHAPSRVIFGCPLRVFADLLTRYVDGLPIED